MVVEGIEEESEGMGVGRRQRVGEKGRREKVEVNRRVGRVRKEWLGEEKEAKEEEE